MMGKNKIGPQDKYMKDSLEERFLFSELTLLIRYIPHQHGLVNQTITSWFLHPKLLM